ncbi:MAG: carboxypeptidase regulatory-like domain-containing protein, partial [Acidobacteria bacterium]|nr:carboxypeptidase regulatory-like domain-containing protein [Acidobacteriota bacterium]
MMKRTSALLLLFVLLAGDVTASAQAIFGSIQGTVTDAGGAVVPDARITARNVNTGVTNSATSNEAGLYFLGELRPGVYDLEIEAAGFQKSVQRGVTLRVEDRLRADIALKPGQVSETVEISGGAQVLQTENNTLGRVIEENSIKQLPLRGRNAFELVLLTPGAQQRDDDEQPRLSGGRARTGEFVLDGGSITTPRRGQVFTQPNLDAIQEFKVQSNGLSAEFGRTVGGVVNATLKSGANDIHGNLFEFHRNSALDATNF